MSEWPDIFQFGKPIGPAHEWFAWVPVQTYYGRWVWLRWVKRVRIVKKGYLDGPDWVFWSYCDQHLAADPEPEAPPLVPEFDNWPTPVDPVGQNPGNGKPVGGAPFDGERGRVPSGRAT